jgi:CRP-like cAMP-binding protein
MTIFTDLQSIRILSELGDAHLKKLEKVTNIKTFKTGEYIFRENQFADSLYALIGGRVSLELNINSSSQCRIKDVYPNESFGISAIVDIGVRTYIADAYAVEDSRVFCWEANRLEKLLYEDHDLGFLFMRNIAKVLKRRLRDTRAQLAEGMCVY